MFKKKKYERSAFATACDMKIIVMSFTDKIKMIRFSTKGEN
jgi:hypothetical protein